jgi:hypothetical protein
MAIGYADAMYDVAVRTALLEPQEAETLLRLCSQRERYYTYEELLGINTELGHTSLDHTVRRIGHSRDYPQTRKIELSTVGTPVPNGTNAYIEGPGHAVELLGATTVATLQQLTKQHVSLPLQ